MGIERRLSEFRRKQIVGHVDPHLLDDEEVVDWARALNPETKGKGFVYLTDDRFLVAWRDENQEAAVVDLKEVTSWGLKEDDPGPLLCVEGGDEKLFVQFRTGSRSMSESARQFIENLARLMPESAEKPEGYGDEVDLSAAPAPRSAWSHARRITVTVLGVAMIIAAPLIAFFPGPWSILLVLAGLALLATEYEWAEDAQDWMRQRYRQARDAIRARRERK